MCRTSEAVFATMGAATIRINTPLKRHPFYAVERRRCLDLQELHARELWRVEGADLLDLQWQLWKTPGRFTGCSLEIGQALHEATSIEHLFAPCKNPLALQAPPQPYAPRGEGQEHEPSQRRRRGSRRGGRRVNPEPRGVVLDRV